MSSLTQIIEEIRNELRIESNGTAYCSIRGAARLIDIDESVLRYQLNLTNKTAGKNLPKLAESIVEQEFDMREFTQIGIPDLALAEIVYYYAHEAGKSCTKQAKLADKAFRALGIRAWIHEELGWRMTPPSQESQIPPKLNQYLKRIDMAHDVLKQVPKGYFCIYEKSQFLMKQLIDDGYAIGEFDLVDGSLGKCWANYRQVDILPSLNQRL